MSDPKSEPRGVENPRVIDHVTDNPETGEVVKYSAWSYLLTGTGAANGLISFTGCTRGELGTLAQAVAVSWDSSIATVWGSTTTKKKKQGPMGQVFGQKETVIVDAWVDKSAVSVSAGPEIQVVAGFNGSSLLAVLFSLASATGTAGTRGAYDLAGIPADCGAAIGGHLGYHRGRQRIRGNALKVQALVKGHWRFEDGHARRVCP